MDYEGKEKQNIHEDLFGILCSVLGVSKEDDDYNISELNKNLLRSNIGVAGVNYIKKGQPDGKRYEILKKGMIKPEVYNLEAVILYAIAEAHNKSIVRNVNEVENPAINDAYKFLPFELLGWEQVGKYLEIFKPMINFISFECDEESLKRQYQREQLAFLLHNGIYSKESLQDRLKEIEEVNLMLSTEKDVNGELVCDKLKQDSVIEQMTRDIEKRVELNLAKQLKSNLLSDMKSSEMKAIKPNPKRVRIYNSGENIMEKKFGIKRQAYPMPDVPMPKTLFEIAREGFFIAGNTRKHDFKYIIATSNSGSARPEYVKGEEESDTCKQNAEKRLAKLKKLQAKINKDSKKGKYNEKGIVTFIRCDLNDNSGDKNNNYAKFIQIVMTQRELINLGVLPKEVGWYSMKEGVVSSNGSLLISDNQCMEFGSGRRKDIDSMKDFKRRMNTEEKDVKDEPEVQLPTDRDENDKIR